MTIRDTNLMFRQTSDGDLTASAAIEAKAIEGTGKNGLALIVNCPTAFTGTSPSLAISIYGSTEAASSDCTSDDTLIATVNTITAYGEYSFPFYTGLKNVSVSLVVAGTSPNLGATEIGIAENVPAWSRAVNFH